jgi:hypothetical protein
MPNENSTRELDDSGSQKKITLRAPETSTHRGSRDRICKPAGESEHYYSSDPISRSGRPAVPRHLRPAAPRTSPTLRAVVDQYRRTVAQLDAMGAPIPSVLTHSRMTELAAINGGYMLYVPDLAG